jgi:hypothetical protein
MAIRFLSGERGRRSLCVTLLLLIEFFPFSLPVMAEDDLCRYYQNELTKVRKELRYRPWNPTPAMLARRKDFEEKVREHCPCRPSGQTGSSMMNMYAPGEYETKVSAVVRSGPDHHCDEVARLSAGTRFTVEGSEGIWRTFRYASPLVVLWRRGGMIDFKGSHFEKEIILWGVRWYVAYPISYRQLEEMMGSEAKRSSYGRISITARIRLNTEARLDHRGPVPRARA